MNVKHVTSNSVYIKGISLDQEESIAALQTILNDGLFAQAQKIRILEAGCGSGSNIQFSNNRHVVGVDLSEEELDKNNIVDEKIVGDLQAIDLPMDSFDLVICWDVLEHLSEPELAMSTLLETTKSGGYLLLAFPNVLSVKGLVAKFTPLWFHQFVQKFVYRDKVAKPGYLNFPTFLRWSISPGKMHKFAKTAGDIMLEEIYESGMQVKLRKRLKIGHKVADILETLVKIFSMTKVTFRGTDCIFLIRKF
jgi:SAM-dependent methyltransferase